MNELRRHPNKQCGAAAVEFSLVALLFFILLFGVMEIARVLFVWNSATEATRYGARVAVVCSLNDSAIVSRMQRIMPNLPAEKVKVEYLPNSPISCNRDGTDGHPNCQFVKVSIENFEIQTYIPVVGLNIEMPTFTTTLGRESLSSSNNPVCT